MIQLIYSSSSFISVGLANNSEDSIYTGYFTVALYTYVMLGILTLFLVLENPMGYDTGDFPGDVYLNDLIKCLDEARHNALEMMNKNLEMSSSDLLMSDDVLPDRHEASEDPRSLNSRSCYTRTPSPCALVYPSDAVQ